MADELLPVGQTGTKKRLRDMSDTTVAEVVAIVPASVVSTSNNSTTLLGSGAVFTGTAESTLGYAAIAVSVFSDRAAAALGLSIQQSQDGTNWDIALTYDVSANSGFSCVVPVVASFYRIVYTNSASIQTIFRLQSVKLATYIGSIAINRVSQQSGMVPQSMALAISNNGSSYAGVSIPSDGMSATNALPAAAVQFNGATLDRQRITTGVVGASTFPFKTVSATASGSTALWTPQSAKKFRIMRYKLSITSNASLSAGAVLVVDLLDAAVTMGQTHSIFVPTTAVTTGAPALYDSDWVDLGNGILSSTANNVLNVNLSAALVTGVCRVICCGTEE